jgi:VIT1/CCC1 family predicted Fe2+/Mn2+ transporter
MATAAKGKTTRAKNPGTRAGYKVAGGQRKTNTTKRAASKTRTANPKRRTHHRRRHYARNPASGGGFAGMLMFAVGGIVAIKAFNLALRYLAPTISSPLSFIAMGAAALGLGAYGSKLPVIGKYAEVAAWGLGLYAGLQVFDSFINPLLPPSLGGTAGLVVPTATQPIQNNQTGQLGTRLHLSNGDYADVFPQTQPEYVS